MSTRAIINDELAGLPLLVLYDEENSTAIAYSRRVGEQTLSFHSVQNDSTTLPISMRDQETGTLWDMLGIAVSGPLTGEQLQQLPAYNAMYFAWSAYWPETSL
jgi:hypothetical protein